MSLASGCRADTGRHLRGNGQRAAAVKEKNLTKFENFWMYERQYFLYNKKMKRAVPNRKNGSRAGTRRVCDPDICMKEGYT